MINTAKKGFTLVELLIVIAILGVLATATVIVLNPAEMLAQARDSNRVSDLASLSTALGVYVSSVASPDLDASNAVTCASGVAPFNGYSYAAVTTASFATTAASVVAVRTVAGAGWLPVAFSDISGGSPISTLPIDPTGTGDLIYRYNCDNTAKTYELNAAFESVKYLTTLDLDGKDGGDQTTFYEVGTSLTL